MGRKRQGRVLDVYFGSSKVGQYSRAPSGATAFRYDPDWLTSDRAFPISLSMPLMVVWMLLFETIYRPLSRVLSQRI